ncbi:M1 family metallopeptidase [Rhabdochromatium marinum]|uniref:M1 family metallopeptidase n=1 Tax=Rhabdochromatium marinum TaxID=48729 RepID=UPI001904BC4C|nr:M1 family aminopeptidase [Rhabdochromatium marinum]MBK1647853.1 peptidase M28 [Rhabdochromatium marinum]
MTRITRHPASPVSSAVRRLLTAALSLMLLARAATAADAPPLVTHTLEVELIPSQGELIATDQLRLPQPQRSLEFSLHRQLHPELIGPGELQAIGNQGHLTRYRVHWRTPTAQLKLHYRGRIRQALQNVREGMGRSHQQSPGTIDAQGVFLTGFTGWYPRLTNNLGGDPAGDLTGVMENFSLQVDVPVGWLALSQGAGPQQARIETHAHGPRTRVQWHESHPQDEIYLIAAPFQLYEDTADGIQLQAWLRSDDPALAKRYLDATGPYLARYSQLIGAYPYAKFAVVENVWDSGYGMPSFTLLGPRVLRLPFILHTSYPHEILHNWWGNGVFIDWDQGNWSEGLTAYLADHLNKALAGQASQYRHQQLKAYADYVRAAANAEIPLSAFRARHNQASQAIGYGKALMVFHMLRHTLGATDFIAGLRRFYADNRFRVASWPDLQTAFEAVSGRDLADFFTAWVERPGALRLSLDQVASHQQADGRYRVSARLRQVQSAAVLPLKVPVVVHDLQGQPHERWVEFTSAREQPFSLSLDQAPLRLAVDPLFDCFRHLEPGETPVSLSTLFGAPSGTLIVPAQAPPKLRRAYQQLATAWQQGQPQWRLVLDTELDQLPEGPIWLLGWENRWLSAMRHASAHFSLDPEAHQLSIEEQLSPNQPSPDQRNPQDLSLVLTRSLTTAPSSSSDNAEAPAASGPRPLGWLASEQPDAVAGLARKLPHYGQYGYLVFSGRTPTNTLKGQWPVQDSPLMHWFRNPSPETLAPVPRQPLVAH